MDGDRDGCGNGGGSERRPMGGGSGDAGRAGGTGDSTGRGVDGPGPVQQHGAGAGSGLTRKQKKALRKKAKQWATQAVIDKAARAKWKKTRQRW